MSAQQPTSSVAAHGGTLRTAALSRLILVTTIAALLASLFAWVPVGPVAAQSVFTLTYSADDHGSISGITPQTVDYGADGTEVVAVPDAGYHFVGWSDLVLTPARTDTNVTADLDVTAAFAIDTFTARVSVDSAGVEGNGGSDRPSVSADGRYVAFHSQASNLVPGDTNGTADVFVRDIVTGITTRVSVDSAGSQADGDSWEPSISADGRYVAFYSGASNLVSGDTYGLTDVFVHDRHLGHHARG